MDITVHRVEQMSPLGLSEVREPSGGPWGSTYIDAEFKRFLRRLIVEASCERLKPLPACGEHSLLSSCKCRFCHSSELIFFLRCDSGYDGSVGEDQN